MGSAVLVNLAMSEALRPRYHIHPLGGGLRSNAGGW